MAREVLAFLRQHTVWLEQNARELAETAGFADTPDPELLLLRSKQRAAELERAIAQMNSLSIRWHAAQGILEVDRAEVRAMAAQAQAMADRLIAEYAKADEAARARAEGVQSQLQGLRRNVRIASRLRPVQLFTDTMYLDKRI